MKVSRKIRYGIVGLGHIAQAAVLPAFRHAKKNSVIAALVSGDAKKRRKIADNYKIENVFSYDEYDSFLESGLIDAVYNCLPNHLHYEFSKRAMKKGIHVLCEKPLALTAKDCHDLIEASKKNNVKFMTAYRLHFDPANLKAIELCQRGRIGDLRYFNSNFSFMIQDRNNIRLKNEAGGGALWDIGVYCVNEARSIFKSEPLEVMCMTASGTNGKFDEVEECAGVVMKFSGNRIASFVCSFGAEAVGEFSVFGTKGQIHVENAYEYTTSRKITLKSEQGRKTFRFKKVDQFAPELLYFSDAILKDRKIEPSGYEGLADVAVIEALYKSAATGSSVQIDQKKEVKTKLRPSPKQKIQRPPVSEVSTVGVRSPS